MLKFHPIIRPTIPDSFFNQTVDFWLGLAIGNWGPQMYQHHEGMKNGVPMSGVSTWDAYEKWGTIPNQNKRLFHDHVKDVALLLEEGTPIVEFGPGSMDDARTLIRALNSDEYIPVDCCLSVIEKARSLAAEIEGCLICPAIYDFFSGKNIPLTHDASLGVFLGLTVGNIPGPVPNDEPYRELVGTFRNLAKTIPMGGYLLVSTDSCQDEERNKALYNEPWHRLFSVNHLYHMAAELPMKGFDPEGFEYAPVWHKHCGLLAHTIIATKNQSFEMGENEGIEISIKKGQTFHCDNSFKYHPAVFEMCAEDAGYEIIHSWQEGTITLYLFHVPSQIAQNNYCAPVISPCGEYSPKRLEGMQEQLRLCA